jgi:hypothetical protein
MGQLFGRGFESLQVHIEKKMKKKFLKNLEVSKIIYIFALLNETDYE